MNLYDSGKNSSVKVTHSSEVKRVQSSFTIWLTLNIILQVFICSYINLYIKPAIDPKSIEYSISQAQYAKSY